MLLIRRILLAFLLLPILALAKTSQTAPAASAPTGVILQIVQQQLDIDGQKATVFNIVQPDGTWGFVGKKGQLFDVTVQNKTKEFAVLHWHGLNVPDEADGVPYVTQEPIPPGGQKRYVFRLSQAGTFWVQSHYKTQLQELMAAPFIIYDPNEDRPDRDVIMFLQDFTFKDPRVAYPNYRRALLQKQANIQLSADNSSGGPEDESLNSALSMDAYLTNYRTLANPDLVHVVPGQTIKLHIIDAAANSNFFIDLGKLNGRLVAVDGSSIDPIEGSKFQVAQGQRLDIEITIPEGDNFYPVLAQAENTNKLTGLVLMTPNAIPEKINEEAPQAAGTFDYTQELKLRGIESLPSRSVNAAFNLNLDGNMLSYIWTVNGEVWPKITPLPIKQDDRVQITLNNKTGLSIPIHLHGHSFEVTQINDERLRGPLRDTILVLPYSRVTIQFDANNPGVWLLQGLMPFQTYGGINTLINYAGFPVPLFKQKDTGVPPTS